MKTFLLLNMTFVLGLGLLLSACGEGSSFTIRGNDDNSCGESPCANQPMPVEPPAVLDVQPLGDEIRGKTLLLADHFNVLFFKYQDIQAVGGDFNRHPEYLEEVQQFLSQHGELQSLVNSACADPASIQEKIQAVNSVNETLRLAYYDAVFTENNPRTLRNEVDRIRLEIEEVKANREAALSELKSSADEQCFNENRW